jgi:transposase
MTGVDSPARPRHDWKPAAASDVTPRMSLVLQSFLPYPDSCLGTSPHQQGWDTKMAELSFGGIDVSKDRLDVLLLPEGLCFSVCNDAPGWAELIVRLRRLAVSAIGLEPSGGYERCIIRALLAAGLSVRRINPNPAHLEDPMLQRLSKRRLVPLVEEKNIGIQSLVSMPGVGPILAYTLLAMLPELGQIDRKQIAALVGLPHRAYPSQDFALVEEIHPAGLVPRRHFFRRPAASAWRQHLVANDVRPSGGMVLASREARVWPSVLTLAYP